VASWRLAVQEGRVSRQRHRLANLARHTARGTLKLFARDQMPKDAPTCETPYPSLNADVAPVGRAHQGAAG
jgi:hypothetical protein